MTGGEHVTWEGRFRVSIAAVEKMGSTYSEGVSVVLIIQSAESMRRIHCHLWSVRLYHILLHYLTNGMIFGGKKSIEHKMCVLTFLQIWSEIFLIPRRNERDIIINVHRSACKVPIIVVRFYSNLNSLNRFTNNSEISNIIKIRPVRAESMRTDGRTDRHDEAKSRFSPFFKSAQ